MAQWVGAAAGVGAALLALVLLRGSDLAGSPIEVLILVVDGAGSTAWSTTSFARFRPVDVDVVDVLTTVARRAGMALRVSAVMERGCGSRMATDASLDDLIAGAQTAVTRVLRRRLRGASLSRWDDRRENERALECYQQAMLELCARFSRVLEGSDPPILNVWDDAARVAHNVANDEIRPRTWSQISHSYS